MNLHDAVQGSRLDALIALRDRLAEQIDDTASSRDVAALATRLTDVLLQIEEITNNDDEEVDPLADLVPGD